MRARLFRYRVQNPWAVWWSVVRRPLYSLHLRSATDPHVMVDIELYDEGTEPTPEDDELDLVPGVRLPTGAVLDSVERFESTEIDTSPDLDAVLQDPERHEARQRLARAMGERLAAKLPDELVVQALASWIDA